MAKPGMCAEVYVIRAGSRYTTDWGKHAEMNKENVHTKKDTKQLIKKKKKLCPIFFW